MSVAAVIVTYNRIDMLKKTIDAVRSQSTPPHCIIVINNGSTDSTPQWLAQQKDIIAIEQENVGASGGFVRGIQQALLCEIQKIWIMDDDVLPESRCLEQLLALSEKGNAIVAPQRYHGTVPFRPEPIRCNFTNPFQSLWVRHPHDDDYHNGVVEVECATFEGPLIDTVVFEKVGLPDKDFFIFADDTEFFERCWRHGFPTLLTEHAQLQRMIPFDAHNTPVWKRYYEARNLVVLDRRFGSMVVRNLRPIFYTIKMCMRSKNIEELQAILLGYYHGVIGRLGKR